MGEKEISDKLLNKLQSIPRSEEDIIYILSRIRKLLELEDHPAEYNILNFYCSLALHSKMDKIIPEEIADGIVKSHTDYEGQHPHPFLGYLKFHEQLIKFLEDHNLPSFYRLKDFKMGKFLELLNSVYSDTPVIVKLITQYQTVVNKDGSISISILKK